MFGTRQKHRNKLKYKWTFSTRVISFSFLILQTLTNVLRDPTHVMKLQTAPILMVHLNANAKRMAFLGMGKHAQVFL